MRRVSLRDACSRVDYGLTASAAATGSGPKFLRITDIEDSFVDWGSVPRCAASADDLAKYRIEPGDIVVARTGASVGRSCWIGNLDEDAVFASYLVRFRAAPGYDSRFIGYVLTSRLWLDYVYASAHAKSAQPNLSAGAMAQFEFECPAASWQRAMGEVLGALDDKIAGNSRLTCLIADYCAATFDSLEDAAFPVCLSTLARFVNGRAYTSGATGTGRIVVRIAELNSGVGDSTVRNDIDVPEDNLARPGDLLFAWSGSLTVRRWFRPEAIVNQHIFRVIPTAPYPMWLVHQVLLRKLADFRAIAADKATTMGHIQRRHLDELVPVPAMREIERVHPLMDGLWRRALAAEQESLELATLRDTLLPELISGRLRVRDAEKQVEDVL